MCMPHSSEHGTFRRIEVACTALSFDNAVTDVTKIVENDPLQSAPVARHDAAPIDVVNTTEFTDAGTVTEVDIDGGNESLALLGMSNAHYVNQNLIDFLVKPQLLTTITWVTSDAVDSIIHELHMPRHLFNLHASVVSRLSYFRHIRGDIWIKINVNPSMSTAGKLMVVWYPLSGMHSYDTDFRTMPRYYTQLPKVEIDLASDRSAVFRLPYSHVFPLMLISGVLDETNASAQWGTLRYNVYTPLRGDSVAIQTWAWMDPDTLVLANPCQESYSVPTLLEEQMMSSVVPMASRALPAQSARLNFISGANLSLERDNDARSSDEIHESLPIRAFRRSVAWAKNLGTYAEGLSYLLSNPRTAKSPTLVLDRKSRDLCTTDQSVPGYVFGFKSGACLADIPSPSYLNVRETEFSHLVQMSVWDDREEWTIAQPEGTVIWESQVHPGTLGTETSAGYYVSAPFAAIHDLFYYWRGHLKITVKVAKTRFHTGRLAIAFTPNVNVGSVTLVGSSVLQRQVIDLESGNEWTFTCPFPDIHFLEAHSTSVGRVALMIVTPLRAAASAPSTVDIVIETSMHKDAVFAYPRGNDYNNQAGTTLPTMESKSSIKLRQMPFSLADPVNFESTCVGDACRDLMTYLKRPILSGVAGPGSISWFANYPLNSSIGATDPWRVLRHVSHWFLYCRGSLRYSLYPEKNMYIRLNAPNLNNGAASGNHTGYVQHLPASTWTDVEVPNLATIPWRVIAKDNHTISADLRAAYEYPVVDLREEFSGTVNSKVEILVSAGDDFQLSQFVGITPTTLPPAPEEASLTTKVVVKSKVLGIF